MVISKKKTTKSNTLDGKYLPVNNNTGLDPGIHLKTAMSLKQVKEF